MDIAPANTGTPMLQGATDAGTAGPAPPNDPAVEDAARGLLMAAERLVRERAPDAPEGFATRLFSGAAAEDLVRYEAAELAEIATESWRFLGQRTVGTAKIRIDAFPVNVGRRLKHVSIVEFVNDDMPFLVDSVMATLTERGHEAHFIVHPLFAVERDADGKLAGLLSDATTSASGGTAVRESVIQVHIDRIDDAAVKNTLIAALGDVLLDVRHAVEDWRLMLDEVRQRIASLKDQAPPLPREENSEGIAFLEWLAEDNFIFLGIRAYDLHEDARRLVPVAGSSLGVLRQRERDTSDGGIDLSPRTLAALREPELLIITKTTSRSRVHRRVAMDQVVIKRFDDEGRVSGSFQIVGLFTSPAYFRSARNIPYLRRKIAAVISRAGFSPVSHSGKAFANVIETYPRDELFQIDEDTLYRFALTILQLNERPRVRVLPRRDTFERFVSALVYVPREGYGSGARTLIGDLLGRAYDGRVASYTPFFPEGPIVRVHFIITRRSGELAHPARAYLEAAVSRLVQSWADALLEALGAAHELDQGTGAVHTLCRGVFGNLSRRLHVRGCGERHCGD